MKKEKKKKKNSYVVWRIPESKHRLNPRKYGIKIFGLVLINFEFRE